MCEAVSAAFRPRRWWCAAPQRLHGLLLWPQPHWHRRQNNLVPVLCPAPKLLSPSQFWAMLGFASCVRETNNFIYSCSWSLILNAIDRCGALCLLLLCFWSFQNAYSHQNLFVYAPFIHIESHIPICFSVFAFKKLTQERWLHLPSFDLLSGHQKQVSIVFFFPVLLFTECIFFFILASFPLHLFNQPEHLQTTSFCFFCALCRIIYSHL